MEKNEEKKGGEKVCLWSICWEECMVVVVVEVRGWVGDGGQLSAGV